MPRGVDRGVVGAGSILCLAVLVACAVLPTDDPPLVLIRLAIVPLAAAAAFVLDEPAAGAVDAVPRSRRRRTGRRAAALAVPLGVWAVGIILLDVGVPSTPAAGLLVEGLGVVAVVVALAAVLRMAGRAEPGEVVASTAGAAILGLLVLDPPLWWPAPPFPVVTGWSVSTAVWSALTVVATAVVVGASRDPYRRARGRNRKA
jgi:hypothetical protein